MHNVRRVNINVLCKCVEPFECHRQIVSANFFFLFEFKTIVDEGSYSL